MSDLIDGIPVAEIPTIQRLEERMAALEEQFGKNLRATGTLLSGLLPGGMFHDRVAETRMALHELAKDPGSPHASAVRSLVALNWGAMGTEE